MSKKVLAAASCVEQKYFLEVEFSKLPEQIQEEIKVICVTLAEKLGCTFLMGFYEDGELYFETIKYETDINFDDIGAELEIKELRRKKKELLASLELWYRVFFTKEGAKEVELGIRN